MKLQTLFSWHYDFAFTNLLKIGQKCVLGILFKIKINYYLPILVSAITFLIKILLCYQISLHNQTQPYNIRTLATFIPFKFCTLFSQSFWTVVTVFFAFEKCLWIFFLFSLNQRPKIEFVTRTSKINESFIKGTIRIVCDILVATFDKLMILKICLTICLSWVCSIHFLASK